MAVNRFSRFTPQEYRQTFVETPVVDYPFQEMFAMGQYKQQRKDQMGTALGKLEADNPEHGILSSGLHSSYTSDYQKGLQSLAEQMDTDPNGFTRAVSKFSTQMQNDPRRKIMQSDAAFKKKYMEDMLLDPQGTTVKYTGVTPEGMKKFQQDFDAGLVTEANLPQYYGRITNVGGETAYSPILDKVAADTFGQYELTEDGQYKQKSTGKILGRKEFEEKAGPLLESFRNQNGTINMSKLPKGEFGQHVQWMKAAANEEGRELVWTDVVDDFMNYAQTRFKSDENQDITKMGKGSSGSGKDDSMIYLPQRGTVPGESVIIGNDSEIKDAKTFSKTTGVDISTGMNNKYGYSVDELTALPSTATSEEREKRMIRHEEIRNKIYEDQKAQLEAKNPEIVLRSGEKVRERGEGEIQREAEYLTEQIIDRSRKYAAAEINAQVRMKGAGSPSNLQLTEDENIVLKKTEDEITYLEKELASVRKDIKGNIIPKTEQEFRTLTYQLNLRKTTAPKGFERLDNGSIVPKRNVAYYKALDEEVAKQFSGLESLSGGIPIFDPKVEGTAKAEQFDKDMTNMAKNAYSAVSGVDVYLRGEKVNEFRTTGDSKSVKGKHITQFPDVSGTVRDFSAGEFVPNYVKFVQNESTGPQGAFLLYGNVKKEFDGKPVESQSIAYDVTNQITESFSGGEQMSYLASARISDILKDIPKGTSGIMNYGQGENVRSAFGNTLIEYNHDDTYSITGKIYNGAKGKVTSVTEALTDIQGDAWRNFKALNPNTNPNKLNKNELEELMGTVMRNQLSYGGRATSQVQRSTDTSVLFSPETVVENIQQEFPDVAQPLSNIATIINKKESSAYNDYDAMNQGGEKGGTVAVGSTTGKNKFNRPLTEMTVGEIKKYQALPKGNENRIHAVGNYQFIKGTLEEMVNDLGITDDTLFNKQTQDRMGARYMDKNLKPLVKNVTSSQIRTFKHVQDSIINRMGGLWIGLQNMNDTERKQFIESVAQYRDNLKENS